MNGTNFYTRIHRLGRITVILALVCFMAVPFGLSAVYGQPLDFAAIVENGAPIFLTFAISGICENLSFMPIIGSGALYMACVNPATGALIPGSTSCSMCRRLIINAGIRRVVIRDTPTEYRVVEVSDWVEEDDSLPPGR